VVKNLASLGKTILLTTHYMDEVQFLADRVAVIARGAVVAEGRPATLGGRDAAATLIRFTALPEGVELPGALGASVTIVGGTVQVRTEEPTRILHELTAWALERGIPLEGLEVTRPTLEDVYLQLTGSGEEGTA
jgi:ABC-2 type transport system ATP-binding protein